MKALITGGAGFIGSHIAERLVKDGHSVRVVDNFRTGHRINLDPIKDDVDFIEGDIRDVPLIESAAKGCDVIFHEAAIVSVPYSIDHPQETHDVNIQGTINVLQAARKHGVKRVVFASSAAIYGEDPEMPKHETMLPRPLVPYGIEKIAGEYYLKNFSLHYGVETVSLRYFNVFGPRQDPSSPYSGVISIFVDRALANAQAKVFGDGEQSRDFVYVDNVVDANIKAAMVPAASGGVYNVGCGQATTLNQLLSLIGDHVGREIPREYLEARSGDIRESLADISKATRELGYEAKVKVGTGLGHLVDFVGSNT